MLSSSALLHNSRKRPARSSLLISVCLISALSVCPNTSSAKDESLSGGSDRPSRIQFSRDVLPILSENCFHCHGPDERQRAADLRLDTEADAAVALSRENPTESSLLQRIFAADPDIVMPPPDSNRHLSADQQATLRQWILEGAAWGKHWSFERLSLPAVPSSAAGDFPEHADAPVRNPIDAFVQDRLHQEGLTPSPEAPRSTLLRRVTLDLTGIPPTPDELHSYLTDHRSDAFERVVDRLLKSPKFGERMAWDWLDAARYADSNGYQGDRERTMWPWRDWVVSAFNSNMPFDQFTIQQLAGDLLPAATDEQKLATGFCRNHMINGEGGRIAEENRVDYVLDMTETMGTVWLGLTLNCCRCHDHKYDPLTRRDYYQLFAFFNQTPVTGGGGDPQTAPVISWLPVEQSQELEDLQKRLTLSQKHVEQLKQELSGRQSAWERAVRDQMDRNRAAGNVAGHWLPLKATTAEAESQQLERLPDLSILATGPNPPTDVYTVRYPLHQGRVTGLLLEALRHKSMTKEGLARSDSGNFVLTELECTLIRNGTSTRLKLLEPKATYEQGSLTVNNVLDGNPSTGWAVYEGRPIDRDHAAVFRFDPPLEISDTAEIQVVLKHESKHVSHNLGRFRISATDDSSPSLPDASHEFHVAIQRPDNERTTEQRQLVTDRFLSEQPDYTTALQKQQALKRRREELQKNAPRVMVMADQPNRRPTFMLNRGLYNDVSDIEVNASTPASLSPEFSGTATANRLDLATWLVSDDQPLVARVTVNRIWQTFFGIGLVKTTEDFGVQSEYPPHKDLLDWLAADFRESGWDVKRLVQTIVTSHTYRQSSVNRISEKTDVSGEHLTLVDVDPDNRLLARGSRFRLPSWMLRDQALAVSGLLDDRQGGPPVNTYQPEGIWEEATFGKKTYARDSGAALYRRSLYIFWRRIIAPTMFFDVASRQTCTVRPSRTNTPLHALLTLNETAYVEAARVLAESLLVGGTVELKANAAESTERSKPTDSREIQDQLDQAFQRILCRLPTEAERRLFDKAISRSMTSYRRNPPLAEELLTVGDSARNTSLAPAEHAAWTNACLMLLNTDEALNHE